MIFVAALTAFCQTFSIAAPLIMSQKTLLEKKWGNISNDKKNQNDSNNENNSKDSSENNFSSNFISKNIQKNESKVSADDLKFETSAQVAMSNSKYLVTAGDIYTLTYVAGKTPVVYQIAVDSTYDINISNIAKINVRGKTYLEVKKQVEEIVTKNYPFSGAQFTLLSPAIFSVTLVGEVNKTSTKNVWALNRVSDILEEFKTDLASTRFVTVKNSSDKEKEYDIFQYERYGNEKENPFLRPGDTIILKKHGTIVSLQGMVERPGVYELKKDETLKDLIEVYGNGLKPLADISRIELQRLSSENKNKSKKLYLNKSNYAFLIESYDIVTIFSFEDLLPVIYLEGAVNNNISQSEENELQGSAKFSLPFNEGENYAFLIRKIKDRFLSSSDLENAYIIRKGEHIKIDASKCLFDAEYYSPYTLEPYDILMIPFKQLFVTVSGAVQNPGRVPYIPNRTWEYYISACGGFAESNSRASIQIYNINKKKQKKTDPILPETTIEAQKNSFIYNLNRCMPIVSTLLSISSLGITLYLAVK